MRAVPGTGKGLKTPGMQSHLKPFDYLAVII